MVTHDPGPWFRGDPGEPSPPRPTPTWSCWWSTPPARPIPPIGCTPCLPSAHVHRLDTTPGFGAAANQACDLVEGAAFYAVLPRRRRPRARHRPSPRGGGVPLQRRDHRTQAGRLERPRRLLQVGIRRQDRRARPGRRSAASSTRSSTTPCATCSWCPGACTLVRADLFSALGGFDAGIAGLGDDLDLCWRAHALGARVLIAPVTRVRHLEALGERVAGRRSPAPARPPPPPHRRWWPTAVASHPGAARRRSLFAVVEMAPTPCLSGHPDQARDVFGRLALEPAPSRPSVPGARPCAPCGRCRDHEVRELQVGGSARSARSSVARSATDARTGSPRSPARRETSPGPTRRRRASSPPPSPSCSGCC
jgi:hypothetical protein